ncbi:hypothetical protein [Dyadobacter frigoris]|uniref:Uncharacterized protein n=1 Tax=Dyadobacter frigoris TaxID=2576211 RepID=A0A4V6BKJ0_9BACT|nr:hypothetical protein [Dyadobacter frigoris]TKT91023.1 hypothetical protein FDK13_18900 [Dyadobacter frigoris]GLU56218.1 hypothetical protein Dfri01_56790 [Dyadobacter frigoris]
MHKIYKVKTQSRRRDVGQVIGFTALLLLMALVFEARAQEGSQGNTTIFGGAQMTFFGNSDFMTPTGGTQPGVTLTERATATISYLNYFGNSLTATGVTDASYVDGYVRKYGTGQFIFPVGDNGNAGQFAASADGTSGAYFHADANIAVTNNLFTGANYPALPSGGPFATATKAALVGTVSTAEYWDIDGANATPITLTWDAGSSISTLTGGNLSKLSIVGWSVTNSRWEIIPSTLDVTSVLGGASALPAGSITSTASIIPNNYRAYTFAAAGGIPDLTITLDIDALSFPAAGTSKDFVINLYEINGSGATNPIVFRINKLSAFTITYPASSGNSNVFGGTPNENSNWTITENASFITVTAKTGVVIPANGQAVIGFNITRKTGISAGTTQNIAATITGGSGGETNIVNNAVITSVSATAN